MHHALRLCCALTLIVGFAITHPQPSLGSSPIDEALGQNTENCLDGIGLTYTDAEFDAATALGGQDAREFSASRWACGSLLDDGRQEFAQCTEPLRFESFAAAGVAPDGWVLCLVGMVIDDNGRGFIASLNAYEAVLRSGDVVHPDARVSAWAGNYDEIIPVDLSAGQVVSAGSFGLGFLAFPNMTGGEFLLANRETGNSVVVSVRENSIADLMAVVVGPQTEPIAMTGDDSASSPWIVTPGVLMRITLSIADVGPLVALNADYRGDAQTFFPEPNTLIDSDMSYNAPEYFTACPPCQYSRTVEFTPAADKALQFSVLGDGQWTITVEAIATGILAEGDQQSTVSSMPPTQTPVTLPTASAPNTGTPTPLPTSTPRSLELRTPTPAKESVVTAEPTSTPVPVTPTDPSAMRDRVIPSAVQLSILAHATGEGISNSRPFVSGSGTVVSSTGLILTNWHLVDLESHRLDVQRIEDQLAVEGGVRLEIQLDDLVQVSVSDGMNPPQPRYWAAVVGGDAALDLALLQIVEDSNGSIDPGSLNLPFVPLGDSDRVGLGDPITIYGYPGVGGNSLTLTQGVVSGFEFEVGIAGRAWITTDAGMSGGSSGGTAVNTHGELIGIPTWGSSLDCRPGDTNGDGMTTAADLGCVPTGISLGRLRPANLARDIINRVTGGGATAVPPTWTPTPSPIPPPPSPTPTSTPAITPVPPATLTPTPIPQTVEPTPELQISQELLNRLPSRPPLDHGSCFGIVDDGTEDLGQVLQRFSGISDAANRLQSLGWQGSAFRQFGCDNPPEGEAGWIDISVHRFVDAASAREAVDYFTAVRLDGSLHILGASPGIGDYSTAMSGPAVNGKDFTLYASQGPILLRVTGVSPSGIPFINVLTVANAVLAEFRDPSETAIAPQTQTVARSAFRYLPNRPDVRHSDCFAVFTDGTYAYADVAAALQPAGLSPSQFDALGWQDGAYRVFRCSDPPFGRAAQLDVVIHQFNSPGSASLALPYFADTYAPGQNQSRSCDAAGPLVVCVTGISYSGSPLSDVAFVLQQVTAAIP